MRLTQWTNIKGLVLFSFIFLVVLLADIFLVYSYYQLTQRFLSKQPNINAADAGVIFFGDYDKNGTKLGPDSESRARAAIDLYLEGHIQSIICVGGYDTRHWKGKPHPMKQFLIKNGVREQNIAHDSLSFNTITNWQEACKIIKKYNFNKVIAISAPLHIYRISKMIEADSIIFHAYNHRLQSFGDYWQIFKDVHREFVSRILSLVLKDRVRNKIVYIYRTLWFEIDKVV